MRPRYRKSRRRRLPEDSSDVLYRALCQAGLSDQARRLRIFLCWNETVGPEIAARTSPQSFSRGCLVVKAASSTWQNELVFLKASILEKINDKLDGKRVVRELKVISGYIAPKTTAGPVRRVLPRAEDFAIARETSMPIPDPEVRAAFERLMAKDRRARS
jgi:predicted nucleic acid-binding Zn ribbon protein